jgi:hypothetical protein
MTKPYVRLPAREHSLPSWVGKPEQEAQVKAVFIELVNMVRRNAPLYDELERYRADPQASERELSPAAELVYDICEGCLPNDDGLELSELKSLLGTLKLVLTPRSYTMN